MTHLLRLSQAIHDPGAVAGRRLGPSWPIGEPGYDTEQETLCSWQLRAVHAVVTTILAEHAALADAARAWRTARSEASAMHLSTDYAAAREAGDRLAAAVDTLDGITQETATSKGIAA
jgi:hypothetical protein